MKLRLAGAIGLLVVGVLAVVIALFGPALGSTGATQYITSRATVTNVVNSVTASGALAPATTYGLNFGSDPRIVSASDSASAGGSGTWLVKTIAATVGQKVAAGDVLATADTTDAQAALDLAKANLAVAQSRYDTDSGGITDADRQSAQIALDQAKQAVTNATQSRDDTINQNSIRVSQSKAALSRAKQQLSDDKAKGAPSTVISADQDAVRQAQDALNLLQAQVDAQNQQARQQVTSAQLAEQQAQNNFDSKTAPASDTTLASDKAGLLQAQQGVDTAQAKVDAATLKANTDGIVVAVNLVAGALAGSSDAVQIRSTQMVVTAAFPEADLVSLAVGQPATIVVSATGDQLTGTVSNIASQASGSNSNSSVVSYAVTVAVASVPDTVRPGMTTQVSVTTAQAANVLAIPAIAINGTAGNYTVRVLEAGGTVAVRPVQVGLITASLAEIKSGLSEGDSVITGTTSSLNSSGNTGGFGGPGGLQGAGGGGGFRGNGGGGTTVVTNP